MYEHWAVAHEMPCNMEPSELRYTKTRILSDQAGTGSQSSNQSTVVSARSLLRYLLYLTGVQALLATILYNRLLDAFLDVSSCSLQIHLCTTIKSIGQTEVDEIYVAVDSNGRQFVLPVQAQGGSDEFSVVRFQQHLLWCRKRLPDMIYRPILTQFAVDDLIAMFEMTTNHGEFKMVQEKHCRLVPSAEVIPGICFVFATPPEKIEKAHGIASSNLFVPTSARFCLRPFPSEPVAA